MDARHDRHAHVDVRGSSRLAEPLPSTYAVHPTYWRIALVCNQQHKQYQQQQKRAQACSVHNATYHRSNELVNLNEVAVSQNFQCRIIARTYGPYPFLLPSM